MPPVPHARSRRSVADRVGGLTDEPARWTAARVRRAAGHHPQSRSSRGRRGGALAGHAPRAHPGLLGTRFLWASVAFSLAALGLEARASLRIDGVRRARCVRRLRMTSGRRVGTAARESGGGRRRHRRLRARTFGARGVSWLRKGSPCRVSFSGLANTVRCRRVGIAGTPARALRAPWPRLRRLTKVPHSHSLDSLFAPPLSVNTPGVTDAMDRPPSRCRAESPTGGNAVTRRFGLRERKVT